MFKHGQKLSQLRTIQLLHTQSFSTQQPPQPPKSLYDKIDPYLRLARFQRQIGTQLLLLPCYWGLALGAPGVLPSLKLISLFTVGAVAARSAGCVINDFTDKDIDKHVQRTQARPLTTGELSNTQAGLFLTGLMGLSFSVLFQLPWESIKYGFMVTPVVFLYPTTKRFFPVPQAVLGTTFNSGVLIGYAAAASMGANMSVCLPFYFGGILWTIVYDTIYAFPDREFDKKLGLKSSTITFENNPRGILTMCSAASVALFALGGFNAGLGSLYFAGLGGVAAHFAWQMKTMDINDAQKCSDLFMANKWLGLMLFGAIIIGKWQVAKSVKEQN
ncbi:hypothetical protein FGO68_gene5471 [Halteria grandinella]|uniref:4-hydroxybenzoate polyprenyltransferase, mitochondrial n=1 Tax=Halteria grandinella TaxID=5974 RepID=A0A8J8NM90_HALGN|nr:hypothetical protein FGO68_gene5471 [Halteria grandinella]